MIASAYRIEVFQSCGLAHLPSLPSLLSGRQSSAELWSLLLGSHYNSSLSHQPGSGAPARECTGRRILNFITWWDVISLKSLFCFPCWRGEQMVEDGVVRAHSCPSGVLASWCAQIFSQHLGPWHNTSEPGTPFYLCLFPGISNVVLNSGL